MSDVVDIWHGLVPADQGAADFFRQFLSDDELARADRFRFPDLRCKFAQRRGILRFVLSRYLKLPPAELRFEMNSYGKPFLTPAVNQTGIQFSLSHSQDRMVIAVTRGSLLGIDIEVVRDGIDNLGLAESFFAAEDVQCIRSKANVDSQRRAFFDIWTGKEAYIKALGAGLSIPLDQFSIDMELEKPRLRYARHRCEGSSQLPNLMDWYFEQLGLDDNESACLAVIGAVPSISVQNFEGLDLDWSSGSAKLRS
jgi:4'-phosphopantetheinyl transferase